MPRASKKDRRFRAVETIFLPGRRVIVAGEVLAGNDPALKGRERFFVEVEPDDTETADIVAVTETADATPGRKRSTPKRKG